MIGCFGLVPLAPNFSHLWLDRGGVHGCGNTPTLVEEKVMQVWDDWFWFFSVLLAANFRMVYYFLPNDLLALPMT